MFGALETFMYPDLEATVCRWTYASDSVRSLLPSTSHLFTLFPPHCHTLDAFLFPTPLKKIRHDVTCLGKVAGVWLDRGTIYTVESSRHVERGTWATPCSVISSAESVHCLHQMTPLVDLAA